jgi:hypothetical protein
MPAECLISEADTDNVCDLRVQAGGLGVNETITTANFPRPLLMVEKKIRFGS